MLIYGNKPQKKVQKVQKVLTSPILLPNPEPRLAQPHTLTALYTRACGPFPRQRTKENLQNTASRRHTHAL